jgi:hypothetical protein
MDQDLSVYRASRYMRLVCLPRFALLETCLPCRSRETSLAFHLFQFTAFGFVHIAEDE